MRNAIKIFIFHKFRSILLAAALIAPPSFAVNNVTNVKDITAIPGIEEFCVFSVPIFSVADLKPLPRHMQRKMSEINKRLEKYVKQGDPQAQFLRVMYTNHLQDMHNLNLQATHKLDKWRDEREESNRRFRDRSNLMFSAAEAEFPPAQYYSYFYHLMATRDRQESQRKYLEAAANNGVYLAVFSLITSTCFLDKDDDPSLRNDRQCVAWKTVLKEVKLINDIPNRKQLVYPPEKPIYRPSGMTNDDFSSAIEYGKELAEVVSKNRDAALKRFPILNTCHYFNQ